MSAIGAVQPLPPHKPFDGVEIAPKEPAQEVFGSVLDGVMASANESQLRAEAASKAFASGSVDDIHGTMIALSQAEIELRYAGTVRNKVIDAFYELWRMQV